MSALFTRQTMRDPRWLQAEAERMRTEAAALMRESGEMAGRAWDLIQAARVVEGEAREAAMAREDLRDVRRYAGPAVREVTR